MLEGYPCGRVNDRQLTRLRRVAEDVTGAAPVHLVPPVREYPDGQAGPFGPVEVLPPVACVGAFHSTVIAPDGDPVLRRSVLTVAWFQHGPAVPSGEDADPALRDIAWDDLALDEDL